MSLPVSSPVSPAARAAAAPPEDPPGTRSRSQGLLVGAVDVVVALEVGEIVGNVGLAEDDRPGREQPVDRDRVRLRDVAAKLGRPPGGGKPRDVVGILDGHGQTVERPPHLAAGERRVRRPGPFAGPLEVEHHDCIEVRVEPIDPGDEVIEQLEAPDSAAPEDRRRARSHSERPVSIRPLLVLAGAARTRSAGMGGARRRPDRQGVRWLPRTPRVRPGLIVKRMASQGVRPGNLMEAANANPHLAAGRAPARRFDRPNAPGLAAPSAACGPPPRNPGASWTLRDESR